MKGLDANNLCSHGGDMLAYLYDEMSVGDRGSFEMHLADCGTCIDDFAELSQSRYPVFEWKQLEFDPLPPPRVVIPYQEPSVSWFDQIRTVFARPGFAFGGVGAALIAAVLTGYFILSSSSASPDLAQDAKPTASPIRAAVATVSSASPMPTSPSDERAPEPIYSPKVVKASSPAKPTGRAPKPKRAQAAKRNDPVPVLSSIDDDEDDSLRLADIFDEIGTGE